MAGTQNNRARVLMGAGALRQTVAGIARAIGQATSEGQSRTVLLVGIQTGGVQLARLLAQQLERRWGHAVPVGELDISMHRDDLHRQLAPPVHPTAIPLDVTNKTVVLVDDVLYTGRSTRAALDALNDLGRPHLIRLAVLIDRGHRQVPIAADYVGKKVRTAFADRVDVQLGGRPEQARVILRRNPEPAAPPP
jgi:pyrimidine operon attenuation protein/uracil phosphoribosyltransferase